LNFRDRFGNIQKPILEFNKVGWAATDAIVTSNKLIVQDMNGHRITWELPRAQQSLRGGTLTYVDRGVVWEYQKLNGGVKLEGTVTAARGLQSYTFPYVTETPLTLGLGGSLYGDGFTVPPPTVLDAAGNLKTYTWTLTSSHITLTFDDAGLALPYVIDPTTNFDVAASADDGDTFGAGAGYAPACTTVNTTRGNIQVIKSFITPNYNVSNGLLRWDTSAILATSEITSAQLILSGYVATLDADARNFIGEWFDTSNWPIDCTDHTATVGATAFNIDITGSTGTITLSSPTSISQTGFTGMRLGISGGTPTGENQITFQSVDGAPAPRLAVTYDVMAVTSVATTPVAANGTKSFTVTGDVLTGVTAVRLEKSGESNINCTSVVVVTDESVTMDCNLTGAADGLWDVVAVKAAGSATGSGILDVQALSISTSSPTSSVPSGSPSFTLTGDGFDTGAQVTLVKSGEATIICTGEVVISLISMTAVCNLTGVATGLWDVVVTNTDTTAVTLTNGLLVSSTVTLQAVGVTSGAHTVRVVGDAIGIYLYVDDVLQDSETPNQWGLEFDGVSGDVDMGSPAALDDIFVGGGTIEAWINADSDGETTLGRIVDKGTTAGWTIVSVTESGGTMDLAFLHGFSTTFGRWDTTGNPITVGADHEIAVSYDNTSVANVPIIYVDGISVGLSVTSTPVGTAVTDAAQNFLIGNRPSDTATFDGSINEVRAWNDIRTPTEVLDNKGVNLTGSEANLAGYWPMDIGSGAVLDDDTSNSNDGMITGATWTDEIVAGRYQDNSGVAVVVVDNANDYQLFSNNAMPAVEFAKINVGGVLNLHYEFDDLPDHQLTDRSGEGNHATARYPDTISGYAVVLQSAEGAAVGGVVEPEAGPEILGDFPVVSNYSDTPTVPGSGFVGFDILNIFTSVLFPFQALTTIVSLGIVIGGMVISARFGLAHSVLIGFVQIALLAVLWKMGGLPGSFTILMILPILFFLMWKRMNP